MTDLDRRKAVLPICIRLLRKTKFVSVLVSVTVARGMTAPAVSFTTPLIAPWSTWANAMPVKTKQMPNMNRKVQSI